MVQGKEGSERVRHYTHTKHRRAGLMCPECGAEYERTADNQFSTCPKGHGKLQPKHFSLSRFEAKAVRKARAKADAETSDGSKTRKSDGQG